MTCATSAHMASPPVQKNWKCRPIIQSPERWSRRFKDLCESTVKWLGDGTGTVYAGVRRGRPPHNARRRGQVRARTLWGGSSPGRREETTAAKAGRCISVLGKPGGVGDGQFSVFDALGLIVPTGLGFSFLSARRHPSADSTLGYGE